MTKHRQASPDAAALILAAGQRAPEPDGEPAPLTRREWRYFWRCRSCGSEFFTTGGARPARCPTCSAPIVTEQVRAELVEVAESGVQTIHRKLNRGGA